MEYVEGDDLGQLRRDQNLTPGQVDAAWVVRVLAYGVALLDALAHLHDKGLLYCDLKPENVMCTRDSVKVVDLGAVQRVGVRGTTYGTEGFEAPEVRGSGPTPQSDLFSLARTVAMALADRPGALTAHGSGITDPNGSALFASFPSLHAWLERGAAVSADDRFASADDMALQLLGVLQQVLAREGQLRVRLPSRLFTTDRCGRVDGIAARELPAPLGRTDEADAIDDQLRLVELYLQSDRWADAADVLERVRADHPGDWRVRWYEAVGQLARGDIAPAGEGFGGVHRLLPGELAPMLALGVVAEHGGDPDTALRWYDEVSQTDEWFISASFGAARCAQAGRSQRPRRPRVRAGAGRVLALTPRRRATARCCSWVGQSRTARSGGLYEVAAGLDSLRLTPPARAELGAQLPAAWARAARRTARSTRTSSSPSSAGPSPTRDCGPGWSPCTASWPRSARAERSGSRWWRRPGTRSGRGPGHDVGARVRGVRERAGCRRRRSLRPLLGLTDRRRGTGRSPTWVWSPPSRNAAAATSATRMRSSCPSDRVRGWQRSSATGSAPPPAPLRPPWPRRRQRAHVLARGASVTAPRRARP